ncbi:MAG: RagB/SusD family nutrient uptake outer membrane protein [Cyclobacteriaceae bacterium]|nr:RagB/SusD family nutrient uptake outer membrane protein [Cyclobacteriaceae bacterium]MDH5247904.1 RagB/SusD family nutrient uptake outer membrane protein [Cyclobacteriaceae bacterium]
MKKILYKLSATTIAVLFTITSCTDQLEQNDPQALSTTEALGTFDGLVTALHGAYDGLQRLSWYGRDFLVIPEVGADNVYISIDNSNRFLQNWNYQLNSSNTQTALWTDAYATILMVNNIIEQIQVVDINSSDQAEASLVEGEAYAIRALAHFDLVRAFAQPYTVNPSSLGVAVVIAPLDPGAEPARATVAEVYAQIDADLAKAAGLLDNSQGPYRITKDAVAAMQARVALYKGDYATAKLKADEVINSGSYPLMDAADVTDAWTSDGFSEEIFTLKFLASESRGPDNLGSIYVPSPGYGDIRPSTDWRKLMDADLDGVADDGDVRLDWIRLYIDGQWYQHKFDGADGVPGLTSPKILRASEMYLIAAEAALETSGDPVPYLNTLRAARGASDLISADLSVIMDERSRELAFEGHRAFDLFRRGLSATRNQFVDAPGTAVSGPDVIPPNDNQRVYPIPQVELDVNQNMVQNPGYEING